MNTPTITRNTGAQWLHSGIAIVGALLISGAVTLGLANRSAITTAPAAPAASLSAGQERFAAMKQRQAEQRDATFAPVSAPASSGAERFAALKQRQLEQHDTTAVPVATLTSGRERFAAFKQTQAELREARIR
jgi:hypothetical protein